MISKSIFCDNCILTAELTTLGVLPPKRHPVSWIELGAKILHLGHVRLIDPQPSMQVFPESSTPTEVYSTMIRAITPRPIAWVSTLSPSGISNLAPYSFFNGVCSQPAALMFSSVNQPDGSKKDTVVNIEANQQFVVNVVPFSLARPMLESSNNYAYEESEFAAAGLTEGASQTIEPPRVAESPIHFECELIKVVNIGEGPLAANVVFGKILLINIDDRVLDEAGKIDPARLDSIGRMGGRGYCRTQDLFGIKLDG